MTMNSPPSVEKRHGRCKVSVSLLIFAFGSVLPGHLFAQPAPKKRITLEQVEDFLTRDCWRQSGGEMLPLRFSRSSIAVVDLEGEKSFWSHYYETTTEVPLAEVRSMGVVDTSRGSPGSPYEVEFECAKKDCIRIRFERKGKYSFSEEVIHSTEHRFSVSCRSPSAVHWWSQYVASRGGNSEDPLNPPVDLRKKRK